MIIELCCSSWHHPRFLSSCILVPVNNHQRPTTLYITWQRVDRFALVFSLLFGLCYAGIVNPKDCLVKFWIWWSLVWKPKTIIRGASLCLVMLSSAWYSEFCSKKLEYLLYWIDCACMAQVEEQAKEKGKVINTLPSYVKSCGTFVTVYRDQNARRSLTKYKKHRPCQLEQQSLIVPLHTCRFYSYQQCEPANTKVYLWFCWWVWGMWPWKTRYWGIHGVLKLL